METRTGNPDATVPPPGLRILAHEEEGDWKHVPDQTRLDDLIGSRGTFVWIECDVTAMPAAALEDLARCLGLHELAVADALNPVQRPKLENYDGHLFGVMHQLDEINEQLESTQIAAFVGRRYVLVAHVGAHRLTEEARRRLLDSKPGERRGAAFLAHTLLDTVVDDYESIATRLEIEVEEMEEKILADPGTVVQRDLYGLKQQLARLRRYVIPFTRVLEDVVERRSLAWMPGEVGVYFRDVYDHLLRINDQVRNVDELDRALLDLIAMAQAQSQNEVTKKLTGWAAIIAVPTFIASTLGMNVLFPGEGTRVGFSVAAGSMFAVALILYAFFKRRGWI